MISSRDVYLSSTVIDGDLPSPPTPKPINSNGPPNYLDNFLIKYSLLDLDDMDMSPFGLDETDDFSDEYLESFDQTQTTIFNQELPNSLEHNTLSTSNYAVVDQNEAADPAQANILPLKCSEIDDLMVGLLEDFDPAIVEKELLNFFEQGTFLSKTNECQLTETIQNNSIVVKTSNLNVRSNLISTTQLCRTGQLLKLRTSPYSSQRARYEKELEQDLRYISTPDDNCIDFEMFELRDHMPINTKAIMRVTRTTIPNGPNGTVHCHPYPLWVKDKHAQVHHGSLLIDITDQIMNNQPIKLEYLIMERLKQDPLKAVTQWPIYTSNQLDCNGFDSLNISKAKMIIERYNLRCSVLRFQIFLVDENQTAYATDLSCETGSIFEYEFKDRKNHPDTFGLERKRLQRQSTTTRQKNASKSTDRVKRKKV